jgi:circadian clock protein KaiC
LISSTLIAFDRARWSRNAALNFMSRLQQPAFKTRSGIPKSATGIAGLDEITRGGLPEGRVTVVMGGAGCGKTVLALQTLVNAARHLREPGIFVAFEENARQIVRNAASFGWNLPELERKKLFFLDVRPKPDDVTAGDFDLNGLLAAIAAKARAMGARRIVFDAIDVLLSRMDNPTRERIELQRLHEWLHASGMTGLITAKVDDNTGGASQRYGCLQFMTDCTVVLSHQTVSRQSQRELRVLKYRGSGFSENAAPVVIDDNGVQVACISAQQRVFPVSKQRLSTGVTRLDAMLGGGYFRGSSILVSGAPGTAKSTLCGSFAAAACRRGERVLYISFDEIAGEHARNLASVGIRLAPHLRRGLLRIYSARSESFGVEQHLVRIHALIREHDAEHVIFDPLSTLFRAGSEHNVVSAAERLLQMTKSHGITTLSTSLLNHADTRVEGTPLDISTVADTWIHLSYAVQGGERNRALTIVKSRGMAHSNQVRELVLSDRGVSLSDVFTSDGEVLMGTLRWQREAADRAERNRATAELRRKEQEIRLAEAELNARMQAIRRELELKRLEVSALMQADQRRRKEASQFRAAVRRRRQADREDGAVQAKTGSAR